MMQDSILWRIASYGTIFDNDMCRSSQTAYVPLNVIYVGCLLLGHRYVIGKCSRSTGTDSPISSSTVVLAERLSSCVALSRLADVRRFGGMFTVCLFLHQRASSEQHSRDVAAIYAHL